MHTNDWPVSELSALDFIREWPFRAAQAENDTANSDRCGQKEKRKDGEEGGGEEIERGEVAVDQRERLVAAAVTTVTTSELERSLKCCAIKQTIRSMHLTICRSRRYCRLDLCSNRLRGKNPRDKVISTCRRSELINKARE